MVVRGNAIVMRICPCVILIVCAGMLGCNRNRQPLSALCDSMEYQALEQLLTKEGYYVDSLYLNYPDSYEFTDRVYSYPCGKAKGTLTFSFDTATITRVQILFCDRSRWLWYLGIYQLS